MRVLQTRKQFNIKIIWDDKNQVLQQISIFLCDESEAEQIEEFKSSGNEHSSDFQISQRETCTWDVHRFPTDRGCREQGLEDDNSNPSRAYMALML